MKGRILISFLLVSFAFSFQAYGQDARKTAKKLNAGIDRKKALDLLVSQDKIVLMATHDPLLALMADRRIVIKNGGIDKIIETTAEEKEVLVQLNYIDGIMQESRKRLRAGMTLEGELCQEVIHNPHSLGE